MEFVFDTSAYINGWRDHYPKPTFGSVWGFIEEGILLSRIASPREVYNELKSKDDAIYKWARERQFAFVDPSPKAQSWVSVIQSAMPHHPGRSPADPFVVAMAKAGDLTVVTYEGRTFAGVPTKRWHRSMPGICKHFDVRCVTLPEALRMLGGKF